MLDAFFHHQGLEAAHLARLERRELIVLPLAGGDFAQRGQQAPAKWGDNDVAGAVAVEALIDAPPREVFELMTDYERLPDAIFGLERAELRWRVGRVADVEFTMKLPFPFGRVRWTNRIAYTEDADRYLIAWEYGDGDLADNTGELTLAPWGPPSDRLTHARYVVQVALRAPFGGAQRVAVRWLLPRVVDRLRRAVEISNPKGEPHDNY